MLSSYSGIIKNVRSFGFHEFSDDTQGMFDRDASSLGNSPKASGVALANSH